MPHQGRRTRATASTQSPRRAPTRRTVLKGSVGAATLLALPGLSASPAAAAATSSSDNAMQPLADGHPLFVYGIPAQTQGYADTLRAVRPAVLGTSTPATSSPVGEGLVRAPAISGDGRTLAFVTVQEQQAPTGVTVSLVDTATGVLSGRAQLRLPQLPPRTLLIVTPVFSASATTLALLLAVTIRTPQGTATKHHPDTGAPRTIAVYDYAAHHELAYLDVSSLSFSGPYDLGDQGTLELANVYADDQNVYVWTMKAPVAGPKRSTPVAPMMTTYALGSGTASYSAPAPGTWPVNNEPIVGLPSGQFVRLINGYELESYSLGGRFERSQPLGYLSPQAAKRAPTSMTAAPGGMVFLNNPGLGRAAILNLTSGGLVPQARVTYPRPYFTGGPSRSAGVLSSDGTTFYTLGSSKQGGLSSYDVKSGMLKQAYSHGEQYVFVHTLPAGELVAVSESNPRLNFFSSDLEPLAAVPTDIYVSAVFAPATA
jgi:hypothetical protein